MPLSFGNLFLVSFLWLCKFTGKPEKTAQQEGIKSRPDMTSKESECASEQQEMNEEGVELGGPNKEGNFDNDKAPKRNGTVCPEFASAAVGGEHLEQAQNSSKENNEDDLEEFTKSSSKEWKSSISEPRQVQTSSQLLPSFLPRLENPVETMQREEFIKHMTSYEGPAVAPNIEFEATWAAVEYELRKIINGGFIPQDSVASSGISEDSFEDFKVCADQLQSSLFNCNYLECLSNLRGFRRLFSRSLDHVLRYAFRGDPVEVLQNIYYGGNGILPEDRMLLADPFHYAAEDESDKFMFDD